MQGVKNRPKANTSRELRTESVFIREYATTGSPVTARERKIKIVLSALGKARFIAVTRGRKEVVPR